MLFICCPYLNLLCLVYLSIIEIRIITGGFDVPDHFPIVVGFTRVKERDKGLP